MGVGEVFDVDVVAHAGAIGGGVVLAVDADAGAAAHGDVEDERDQVRFGLVVLTVAFDGAGTLK